MIRILKAPIARTELQRIADESFGDFVKAVVDIQRNVMAIGAELHADEEFALLEDGCSQKDLWGVNLYPSPDVDAMIEFDSMIDRPRGIDRVASKMKRYRRGLPRLSEH